VSEPRKVALVTGAARGIGAATARRLVHDGFSVVAFDSCRGEDPLGGTPYALAERGDLDALAEELGTHVLPLVGDVRDRASLDSAVSTALTRWGRLDVVVAAAAVIAGGTLMWDTAPAELDLLWDVNVRGMWNTAAASVPAMLAGPDPSGCRFVGIASVAGSQGLHLLSSYTTAKHAVVGLVKGLAADLVGTGATAMVVSPGSTRTHMLDACVSIYQLDSADPLVDHQLLGRVIEPDEIAAAVAFCCSPEGRILNGSIVHADGGFTV